MTSVRFFCVCFTACFPRSKPSNLLYEERSKTVKICDFGLSRLVPYGDVLQGSKVRGSAIYIAPEVAQVRRENVFCFVFRVLSVLSARLQGHGIDHTADVYAFGIALYEFIERKIPFAHHSEIKVSKGCVIVLRLNAFLQR